jgi:hypothetical protein
MGASMKGVEQIIGHVFVNPAILREVLQASGSEILVSGTRQIIRESDKRLALNNMLITRTTDDNIYGRVSGMLFSRNFLVLGGSR